MSDHIAKGPSYHFSRETALTEISTITVFGVPLQAEVQSKAHQAIWWCGSETGTQQVRRGTKRIWHLPVASIQGSGDVPNFTYDGFPVKWFRLADDAVVVEEKYQRVALGPVDRSRSMAFVPGAGRTGVLFKAAKDRPPDHPTMLGDVLKGVIGLVQWLVDNWPEAGEDPDPPAGPKGEPTDAGPA